MRLPPELRLMVYRFALQDITDPIMFPGSGEVQKPHLSQGSLALLCTSKQLRSESHISMWNTAHRYCRALHNTFKAVSKRSGEVSRSTCFGSPAWEQANDNFDRAYHQATCISAITRALARASRADYAYRWVQTMEGIPECGSRSHHKANKGAQ
jgi:hypothetical protein